MKRKARGLLPRNKQESIIFFSIALTIVLGFLHVQMNYAQDEVKAKADVESSEVTKKPASDNKTLEEDKQKAEEQAAAQAAAQARQAAEKPAAPPATPSYPAITAPSPRGAALYVNPSLAGRPAEIASQPTATWFGEWSGSVQAAAHQLVSAASAQGKVATIVAYNIPGRDCGSYSAGGSASANHYKEWVRQLAAGIGQRKAIVILEPDALAQIDCLPAADQENRYALLADAVNVLATQTGAFIYLDAGHGSWVGASTMAERLRKANVGQARGFALNVSNYVSTQQNTAYGNTLSALTGGKSFVIDTSRNGNGSNGEWCNPRGRALGASPTTTVGGAIDAYLWAKVPGESDGSCNGGPSAGVWWQEYAEELIANRR